MDNKEKMKKAFVKWFQSGGWELAGSAFSLEAVLEEEDAAYGTPIYAPPSETQIKDYPHRVYYWDEIDTAYHAFAGGYNTRPDHAAALKKLVERVAELTQHAKRLEEIVAIKQAHQTTI